jgi:hypothetical protein
MLERARRRLEERRPPDRRALARHLLRHYYTRGGRRRYNPHGIDLFAEDWDNMLVLDACRYDVFAEEADLDGRLESRVSRGSMTREWVRANFADRRLLDLVYVTANGNYAHVKDEIDATVHEEVPLWHDEHRTGPDDTITRPEVVAEAAREYAASHPHKRLLVHFVQPHTPYLGSTGERFDPRVPLGDIPRRYDVSDEVIERAYRENLSLVLEEVTDLLDDLPGKTVVTADHGELLGERLAPLPVRDYGHPDGIYRPELVTVPWLVSTNGDRKRITREAPTGRTDVDRADVEEHLRDLGYAT